MAASQAIPHVALAAEDGVQSIFPPTLVPDYPLKKSRGALNPFFTPPKRALHPYFFRHFLRIPCNCRFLLKLRPVFAPSENPPQKKVVKNMSILLLTRGRLSRYYEKQEVVIVTTWFLDLYERSVLWN